MNEPDWNLPSFPSESENLIENGGFEDEFDGWEGYYGGDPYEADIVLVSDSYSGKYAIRCSRDSYGLRQVFGYGISPPLAKGTYYLGFKYKADYPMDNVWITFEYGGRAMGIITASNYNLEIVEAKRYGASELMYDRPVTDGWRETLCTFELSGEKNGFVRVYANMPGLDYKYNYFDDVYLGVEPP
ncbi:MAG: hypothetical protein GWN14_06085 [candidate division Zixibacteria bacterium]|nr:hypothetical protein [candidate division Zixibacteria bacterium]